MNNKETTLNRIIDIGVKCCATDLGGGRMNITRDDVIGKCRAENVVMTRALVVRLIAWNGYSITTISQLLGRSTQAVRHLAELGQQLYKTSRAYRIAEAEATLMCKDID